MSNNMDVEVSQLNINVTNNYFPIHDLMRNGRNVSLEDLDAVISAETDINLKDNWGRSPIYYFFENPNISDDINLLNALLSRGVNMNIADEDNYTPLHFLLKYAENLSLEILDTVLSENSSLINLTNKWGRSPVFYFFKNLLISDDSKLLKALIRRGANLNIADEEGFTPFHYLLLFATDVSDEILRIVFNTNANVNFRNKWGRTPIFCFFENDNLANNVSLLKTLISMRVNVNVFDEDGCTPLHYLMLYEENVSFEILTILSAKTNINFKNKLHRTPILYLCQNDDLMDDIDLFFTLLLRGADMNIKDTMNFSPLDELLKNNACDNVVKLVINCELLTFQKYFDNFCDENILVSQLMSSDYFQNLSTHKDWCLSHVTNCVSELLQMMKQPLYDNFTLAQHLLICFENRRIISFPSETIIDKVIDILARNIYPHYSYIILHSLHNSDFIEELFLCTDIEECPREAILNCYSLSPVAKFLSKEDLITFRLSASEEELKY